MIPINSICLLTSGLFFSFISFKVYFSYRKNNEGKIGNFFNSLLFLSLTFVLTSTPGIVFEDLSVIGYIFLVYPFFIFLALAYFGIIPLQILGWKKTEKAFFSGTIILGLVIALLNVAKMRPAVIHRVGKFVYWQDGRGVAMNVMIGATLSSAMLLLIAFFIIQGLKSSEKRIRNRAFIIAAGLFNLMVGSVINFIVGGSPNVYVASLVSTFFFILAGVFLLVSTYYKPS